MEFITTCLEILCNQCDIPSVKRKQKMLAKIVSNYLSKIEVNETFEEVYNCLKEICSLHSSYNEEPGNIISTMIRTDNFPKVKNIIKSASEVVLDDERIDSFLKLVSTKTKSLEIINRSDDIIKSLVNLKSMSSDNEIVSLYETIIHKEYISILKSQEDNSKSELEISDTMEVSDIQSLIEEISIVSKKRSRISSGIKNMDSFLQSGFEATRIYVFGGKPGLGKSTLILNFFLNAIKTPQKKSKKKSDIVVYITLENDNVETFERIARISTGKELYINNMTKEETEFLAHTIKDTANKNFRIKYMVPYTTTTMDIFLYLDRLSEEYDISCVLVDYLNLVSSSEKHGKQIEKRFELGMVTAELKVIAKRFQCPVIVPTQLNTAGYDGIPSMKNLDESRQIAQNADFIGLMFEYPVEKIPVQLLYQYPEEQYKIIGINIDKNRNAPTGLAFLIGQRNTYSFMGISLEVNKLLKNRLYSKNTQQDQQDQQPIKNHIPYNNQTFFNNINTQYNDPILNTTGG